jgi:hypothetical protein
MCGRGESWNGGRRRRGHRKESDMTNGSRPDIVGCFREGLDVVRRYPVLLVPPVAVQVVVFALGLLLLGGAAAMFAMGGLAGGLAGAAGAAIVFFVVSLLLALVASAVVVVMAREALGGREPVLGDAVGSVMGRFLDVVVVSVLSAIIIGVGLVLLIIPGIVAMVFLIFALPAVLLDGDGPPEALRRSVRVVKGHLGPVVGLAVGWILTLAVVFIAGKVLGLVPILGSLVSAVLDGAAVAYLSVVTVRIYQALPHR